MFQKLVSRNDDLKRLVDRGYAVGFDSNCLIVRDIPYLDANGALQIGTIATKLVFIDNERVQQDDHQVFFAGSKPYNLDGTQVANLTDRPATLGLSAACSDVVIQWQFSNKPRENGQLVGFADFFAKIESYVALISGPAIAKYNAEPLTFRIAEAVVEDSVFKLHDTLTSRAEISDLSVKFRDDIIAVIGLGGTGSYLLDLLVRMAVREIRAFDSDRFYVHNAFRSPGRTDPEELGKHKAEIYQARYDGFRHGLKVSTDFVDSSSEAMLDGVTFAFVCVDKGSSRGGVFDLLLKKRIPFIDVGMGPRRRHGAAGGPLCGMIRMTYYSAEHGQQVRDKALAETSDNENDIYRTNVQLGELNALNACLALIRFKQLRGFYVEEEPYYTLLFDISDLKIVGETQL